MNPQQAVPDVMAVIPARSRRHYGRFWQAATLATALLLDTATLPATADEPDWAAMPYTSHSAFQAVTANGNFTFDLSNPVRMRGVLLNRPQDMLKGTAGAPGFMGGMWQVYSQTIDVGDWGGTAQWMGQNIGSIRGKPDENYTNAQWIAELARLSRDAVSGHRFRPGDLVEVRARAPGLFNRGKTNVNEQHNYDPALDFDIILLQANAGLPAPTVITLADVKDAGDAFLFDQTRMTGAERYQATLVRINGVTFTSTAGWGPGASMTIQDGTGRTLPVLLGRSRGFIAYGPPAGVFDIVGIFDQEDTVSGDGWIDGYRLWVMGYNGTAFIVPSAPGDTDGDADVDMVDFGYFQACFNGPNQPWSSGYCDDFDFDFDGDVDLVDFGEFQACFNGPNRPPACQ